MSSYNWKERDQFIDWDLHKTAILDHFKQTSPPSLPQVETAIDIIDKYFLEDRWDQVGKAKVHMLRTCRILYEEIGITNTDLLLIAILHDTLEDTEFQESEMRKIFGKRVTEGVKLLTQPTNKEWTKYVEDIINSGNSEIFLIKVADRLDNTRSHSLTAVAERRIADHFKTTAVFQPLIKKGYPKYWAFFEEALEFKVN